MRRRRLLASVGGFAVAGSAVLGTGAFTSVEAERSVSITVADDNRAFLGLEPIAEYGTNKQSTLQSYSDGQSIGFEIPGSGNGENSDAEGVGLDSIYEFHELLEVYNKGTQAVKIDSTYDGDNLADLALVNDDGVLGDDPPTLSVGASIDVGLSIDTHGSEIGEFDETITIVAERVGGNQD
jgi:hypothetical protein